MYQPDCSMTLLDAECTGQDFLYDVLAVTVLTTIMRHIVDDNDVYES